MTKIEEGLREFFKTCFTDEEELNNYLNSTVFTIEFGEYDVLENRNHNPEYVKREAADINQK
jgi:hypothetical protein